MRAVFSIVGVLLVLVLMGWILKKQLSATVSVPASGTSSRQVQLQNAQKQAQEALQAAQEAQAAQQKQIDKANGQ